MPTEPVLFGPFNRVDAQRHHRFGQRIAFDDAAAGQRFEARLGVGHQRRGAGEANADRFEIDLAASHVRMVEQRDIERRHAVEKGRLAPRRMVASRSGRSRGLGTSAIGLPVTSASP